MGRFDAATGDERRDLVVDAIHAHRERESQFTTFETGRTGDEPAPWVQFAAPDSILNLDCTDDELDRLDALLGDFGGCTVHERTSPGEAEGTNVRIETRVDDGRVAQLVERVFREVYDQPEDYRLWATAV